LNPFIDDHANALSIVHKASEICQDSVMSGAHQGRASGHGHTKRKDRALARTRRDVDCSAHGDGQSLTGGEAESGALDTFSGMARKRLEQPLERM